MADINVSRKGTNTWLWVLAAVVVVALVIWAIAAGTGSAGASSLLGPLEQSPELARAAAPLLIAMR